MTFYNTDILLVAILYYRKRILLKNTYFTTVHQMIFHHVETKGTDQ